MSDVDDLIEELFPKKEGGRAPPEGKGGAACEPPASPSNWDDTDEANSEAETTTRNRGTSVSLEAAASTTANVGDGRGEDFDDSDESVEETVMGGRHTVPFPPTPGNMSMACNSKCFVTNVGSGELRHPSVAQLLLAGEGKYDKCSSNEQLLLRKGAFHALKADAGNGCTDKTADEDGRKGGCPFILCRRCNYTVIRLQDAEWDDEEGKMDLYLTVRNFYPDWSRLASSLPVGQMRRGEQNTVLKTCPDSAAYCCQCSWLTVKSAQEVIDTRVTDHTKFVGKELTCCFATQLPLISGEKRRPPLWVCGGHVPKH